MKTHDYQRGDRVVVRDRGKWREGKVVDTGVCTVIVHIDGYSSALTLRADDSGLKRVEDANAG